MRRSSSAATYEEQQAELRRLEEGSTQEDEVRKVDIPKEPEVNAEVYKDVEPYLFRGFLTQAATINGVTFVFKTLNHHEHELVRLSGGYDEKGNPATGFWDKFLAQAVFMVEGVNILPDRAHWVPKIADMFREYQPSIKSKIVRYLSELNRRASQAVHLTECYATEKYSRYRWYQLQSIDMTSTAVTGISGTDQLGMNWAQWIWRALNKIDDFREALEHQWEHAKFIGSCSAGKAIQRIYQQDTERRKKEKEEQLAHKDSILRHIILGEPMSDSFTQKAGAVWVTSQTVEQLVEQLEHDLKGEKDWHDTVVDRYEGRARQQHDEYAQRVQELHKQREQEFGGKFLVGSTDMQGLTSVEVTERIARKRQLAAQQLAGRVVHLEQPASPIDEVDTSVGTTDRDPSSAQPLPSWKRPPGAPFRSGR